MARRSPEDVKRALNLADQGKEVSEIARELDIPYATIYDWVKRSRDKAEDSVRPLHVRAVPMTPPTEDTGSERQAEMPPTRPAEGRVTPFPTTTEEQPLNYKEIEGYISGIYRMSVKIVAPNDFIAQEVVNTHADEAAAAWAEWIKSEPKVAAFLQKMMVGTPAGKLIYVHVSMGVGYFFARAAAEDLQRRLSDDDAGAAADDAPAASAA